MSALDPVDTLSDAEPAPVTKVEPKAAPTAPTPKPSAKGKASAAKKAANKKAPKPADKNKKKVAKVADDSQPPAVDPPESPGPNEPTDKASDEEGAEPTPKAKNAPKAMKRPASSAGSAPIKKPAAKLPSPPGELKVKKYPYTKKGVWAISVNGKEYVQAGTGSRWCLAAVLEGKLSGWVPWVLCRM